LCKPTATFIDIDHFLRAETCGERSYFGQHMSALSVVDGNHDTWDCVLHPFDFYQNSDDFGDGDPIAWNCALEKSPLADKPDSCHLIYQYDFGKGAESTMPCLGKQVVPSWNSEKPVLWAIDMSSEKDSDPISNPASKKSKKSKDNKDETDSSHDDDNWLGKMFPMIELMILRADCIFEMGLACGWNKEGEPSMYMVNEGGNLAECMWSKGWGLFQALEWMEEKLVYGEMADWCLCEVSKKVEDFEDSNGEYALKESFPDSKFPHLAKWIMKPRPGRSVQIGSYPGEPFLTVRKGNPRFNRKSCKIVWGYPKRPTTLTEIFMLLNDACSQAK